VEDGAVYAERLVEIEPTDRPGPLAADAWRTFSFVRYCVWRGCGHAPAAWT